MIYNIKELQSYVLKDADDFEDPLFKKSFMMTSPGCSKERIEELKRVLPGIPESYTKWVEAIHLNGVEIGYFSVSTYSFHSDDIIANLIEGNQEGVMFWEQIQKYHLYAIGNTSDFGIFVATSFSPYKEGEIIAIDEEIYGEEDNQERWIYRLSKDFEQFLIVTGNINQIRREIKDEDKRKQVFLERLKKLDVSEEYYKAWLSVF